MAVGAVDEVAGAAPVFEVFWSGAYFSRSLVFEFAILALDAVVSEY